jgi:hypothetical protein
LPTGRGAILIGFDAFGGKFEEDLGVTTGLSIFGFATGSGLAISGPIKSVGGFALTATCSWL